MADFSDVGRFSDQGSVTVDANGAATVTISARGCMYEVDNTRVLVTPPGGVQTNESRCYVYRNMVSPNYQVDGTDSGSTGDSSDTVHYLADGESLVFVWSGADVSGIATAVITGWKSLPHRGFRTHR